MKPESATRLFFSTLGRMAPETEAKATEKLAALAWAGAEKNSLSLTTRELQNAVNGVLSGAPAITNHTRAELRDILTSGTIKYTEKPAELSAFGHIKTGFIQTRAGDAVPIIERTLGPTKAAMELKVAKISDMMPFQNYSPVTVMRESGVVVQQRLGMSLEDWARQVDKRLIGTAREWDYSTVPTSFSNTLRNNIHFKRQMEQTQVQRSILGDFDSTPANFGIALQNRKLMIGNLDMNQALELVAKPAASNMISLHGMHLSNRTISYVERFANFQKSPTGKEALRLTGSSTDELHFMQLRTDWFLKHKRLGPV